MRKALLVCVVALLAGGALIVILGLGRVAALWIGGALALVGVPLMALARVQIGSAFAVAPKAQALVTHGLYAKIPHPLYVFFDVALLGVVIAHQDDPGAGRQDEGTPVDRSRHGPGPEVGARCADPARAQGAHRHGLRAGRAAPDDVKFLGVK
jgi:hypothetical protein